LVDPARALDEAIVRHALPEEATRVGVRRGPPALAALIVVVLIVAWLWTPLKELVEPERLVVTADSLTAHPLGAPLAAVFMALATTLMVPVTALIVVVVLLFGPWLGFAVALSGSLIAAAAGYGLGRLLWPDLIRKLTGKRLQRITPALAKRGLLAMVAVRIVPVAPFTVVNLVIGSSKVRFGTFMLGTLIGMSPGILVLALAADRVVEAARNPNLGAIAVAVVLVAALVFGLRILYGRLARMARRPSSDKTAR
jgi:uncharacterized membrane protein YdjX (TVP38/TMEM64 family)